MIFAFHTRRPAGIFVEPPHTGHPITEDGSASISKSPELTKDRLQRSISPRTLTLPDCQRIIETVKPLVSVSELAANSVAASSQALRLQYRALHRLPKTEAGTQ